MSISKYLEKMKEIQIILLDFLDKEDNEEENLLVLTEILESQKIKNNRNELKSFLRLLLKIANNHYRSPGWFSKIEKILKFLEKELSEYYSNTDLINIFISSKRIILFLINEHIINVDSHFVKKITAGKYVDAKYPQYFAPEIKPFMHEIWFPKKQIRSNNWIEEIEKEVPENFEINRMNGENESYICQMIRNDLVKEFIAYISKNNYSLKSPIKPSIYETNSILVKAQIPSDCRKDSLSLIEYVAFFGSIQIFNYLRLNGVELSPSLWIYVIHSNNPELIHLLEENRVEFGDGSCRKCLIESIKCHGNGIVKYFQEKYFRNDEENQEIFFIQAIKYFNFAFIQNKYINQSYFYYFCQYGYYVFVETLLDENDIDINASMVKSIYFILFYIPAFYIAVEKENVDIVKLLLTDDKLNINLPSISNCIFSIKF